MSDLMGKVKNKYVAVDLDGTLAEYDGWSGLDNIEDPKPHARICMRILEKAGFNLIIYTCRADRGLKKVRDWLETHRIPYDHINFNPEQHETAGEKKLFAHYYIDDRNGSFQDLFSSVKKVLDKEGINTVKIRG